MSTELRDEQGDVATDVDESNPAIAEREVPVEVSGVADIGELVWLALDDIVPDPDQPRLAVDDDLADSIRANGVLQPVSVRRTWAAGAAYILVDGERRYRGARAAGLATIPARLVEETDPDDRLLHQVVFNDGKRLAPMEEARAWSRIMAAKSWNVQQLAKALGRPKSTVSDRLALLDAPKAFLPWFERGFLSAAAAPIVRQVAALPARALERVVAQITQDYDFDSASREFAASGKAIALDTFQSLVDDAVGNELALIDPNLRVDYKGKTVEVGKQTFAVDADAYRTAAAKARAGIVKTKGNAAAVDPSEAKQRAAERKAVEQRKAAEAKAKAERERKQQLYRAQFDAVAAKLPGAIDGKLALVLIGAWNEQQYMSDEELTAVGVPAIAQSPRGLLKYAETLSAGDRMRLLVRVMIYADRPPYNTERDHVAAAAKAIGVDLKKVKAPDPEYSAGAAAARESATAKAAAVPPKKAAKPAPKKAAKKPSTKAAKRAAKPAKKGRR